jgi:hypothetical protein
MEMKATKRWMLRWRALQNMLVTAWARGNIIPRHMDQFLGFLWVLGGPLGEAYFSSFSVSSLQIIV